MRRVKFEKGKQKEFLNSVVKNANLPSLRSILQQGFDVKYTALKNYYSEIRLLPEDFFRDLCYLAKISPASLKVEFLEENWGKVKGGKKKRN